MRCTTHSLNSNWIQVPWRTPLLRTRSARKYAQGCTSSDGDYMHSSSQHCLQTPAQSLKIYAFFVRKPGRDRMQFPFPPLPWLHVRSGLGHGRTNHGRRSRLAARPITRVWQHRVSLPSRVAADPAFIFSWSLKERRAENEVRRSARQVNFSL